MFFPEKKREQISAPGFQGISAVYNLSAIDMKGLASHIG